MSCPACLLWGPDRNYGSFVEANGLTQEGDMIAWILMGKGWQKVFAAALWTLTIAAGDQSAWANENAGIESRAIPNAQMKTLRPAASAPSQEDNLQRQLPPPPRPGDLQPATQAELEQHCL